MSQSRRPTSISFAPTTARGPRIGLAGALVLHGAVLAAALFSFQHRLDIVDQSAPIVPVDLVTVSQKTNVMASNARRHLTPHRDIKPPEPASPAPPPLPKPSPLVEPLPQPARALPTPAEPLPKPIAKPPDRPDKKPTSDDFSALLNKLTVPSAQPRNARPADRTVSGVGAMNAMTADLVDALKNQIAQCWSPPVGAPHPEQLITTFRLFLNPDGSVSQTPQLSLDSTSTRDPFMRAAAEAARRAIMTCQPYKLPADKYSIWRDITIDFDPRKMVQ